MNPKDMSDEEFEDALKGAQRERLIKMARAEATESRPDLELLELHTRINTLGARRIVACVDACEGLSTDALERGRLRALLTLARNYGQEGELFPEVLHELEGK